MHVRRSVLLSTADKLFATLVKFGTLIVTARLLTPEQIGVSVLGMAVLGVAGVIREFGGASYLIQVDEPTPERVRTVFTIQMLFTLPLALGCFFIAAPAAQFYQTPGLRDFLWVTALCFVLGPFVSPIYALLSRRMAFAEIAILNITGSVTYAGFTIGLALAGFGFMSFAWASLISALMGFALSLYWHPKFAMYRVAFHDWRAVVDFGFADSVRNLMYYLLDSVPLMAFGRTLGTEAVGLFQRAVTLSALPTTTLLAGLAPVLLPAFANHAREKRALKDAYLHSLSLITSILWPVTLWIIILAQPVVLVLLGEQWLPLVPLVQIIGTAYLIWFPVYVTNPILIAAGGIRDTLALALITIPLMILTQSIASIWGLYAAVWSLFVTIPWYVFFAVYMVKRRVPFTWNELGSVLARSAAVALVSATAPALIVMAWGGPMNISIVGGVIAGGVAVMGWFAGLHLLRHPMLEEVQSALAKAQSKLAALQR